LPTPTLKACRGVRSVFRRLAGLYGPVRAGKNTGPKNQTMSRRKRMGDSEKHCHAGERREELEKTLRPVEVLALALGAIVGWGCFVLPGIRFLPMPVPSEQSSLSLLARCSSALWL